ncbi:MAG: hypothetical protein KY432_06395, partial [Acidobacteria bacterium]|nr:hypothetical protein [Acidobacteriota bacterium]
ERNELAAIAATIHSPRFIVCDLESLDRRALAPVREAGVMDAAVVFVSSALNQRQGPAIILNKSPLLPVFL